MAARVRSHFKRAGVMMWCLAAHDKRDIHAVNSVMRCAAARNGADSDRDDGLPGPAHGLPGCGKVFLVAVCRKGGVRKQA
jgi:hypothetical protein